MSLIETKKRYVIQNKKTKRWFAGWEWIDKPIWEQEITHSSMFIRYKSNRLPTARMLRSLGYSVRVGLANRHIIIMHYSEKTISCGDRFTIICFKRMRT